MKYVRGDTVVHKTNPRVIWMVREAEGLGNDFRYLCMTITDKGKRVSDNFWEDEIDYAPGEEIS